MVAWLLSAGGTLLAGRRVAGGGWLALHLVLLGAVTNAIVQWSEHFAASLLHAPASPDRVVWARVGLLNLAVVAVLAGVQGDRPRLVAAGAGLLGVVVAGHAWLLGSWLRRGLGVRGRLGDTVWFYLAGSGALMGGVGLGVMLSAGTGSADSYRALRLAHAHLNVLGWIGLAVVGTLFTLWPTVLRTRMVAHLSVAARWVFLLCLGGLAATVGGLLLQQRGLALAGLAAYLAGLGAALVPFVATMRQRQPQSGAAWALLAAVNLGVALRTFGPATGWTVPVAWWLIGLGIGWFVLLAVAAMIATRVAHRVTEAG